MHPFIHLQLQYKPAYQAFFKKWDDTLTLGLLRSNYRSQFWVQAETGATQPIYLQSATKLAGTYPSRTFLEICRNYLLQKWKWRLNSPHPLRNVVPLFKLHVENYKYHPGNFEWSWVEVGEQV